MAFEQAQKQVRFAKVSFQGKEKSGKTVTASMLAIDTCKKYHPGKPVAFLSSEPGVDYVLDIFAAENVPVLTDRRADFLALRESIPEAIKAGAGVLLIDSASTYWRELVKAYKTANNIRKLMPFHYTPIKQTWAEFTDQFVPAKVDIFVCGRLGYEFEELESEDGERDTRRVGTKMKTEGDFNYETDLIVEMEKRDDLDTSNADTIKLNGKKKLVRRFQARSVHVATVKGSRVWALNGQSFQFRPESAYQVGMAANVGKCFAPYFEFIKGHTGTGDVLKAGSSAGIFEQGGGENWHRLKVIAMEDWDATMAKIFPGQTAAEKQGRAVVGEAITGVRSKTAFEGFPLEKLQGCAKLLRKLEPRISGEKMPSTIEGILAELDAAKSAIADELAAKEAEEKEYAESNAF